VRNFTLETAFAHAMSSAPVIWAMVTGFSGVDLMVITPLQRRPVVPRTDPRGRRAMAVTT
jgi:hypothetical protein